MKRAVSVSLGSSQRDKHVTIQLRGQTIDLRRIGTDGDVAEAQRRFGELDGQVDALSMGGVDLYLYLDGRAYPLRAAHKLVRDVHRTPVVDGSGLKRTLERRVFELAAPQLGGIPHVARAFVPMGIDRLGLAQAVDAVSDSVTFGDFMVGLGLPIPVRSLRQYKRMLRAMLPLVSYFPMSMLFYGSKGTEIEPKYERYWHEADLIACDFMFMKKHLPDDLEGKTIVTNTTTAENVELLRQRGVARLITSTPRYEGRSFGTNMMEAALTAYRGEGRTLRLDEINALIDALDLRPSVQQLA